jgi:hypothetical protein
MEWAVANLVAVNTELNWWLQFKVRMFYLLCTLQKYVSIVPSLDYSAGAVRRETAPAAAA